MTNQTKDKLREEFADNFRKGEGAWHPNFELITHWWLTQFDSLIEAKVEEIRGMKIENNEQFGDIRLYNEAISDVTKILTSHE